MKVELLTAASDAGATVHLLVRLQADAPAPGARNPVNLALVIDRSSSMRGPRIAQAIRAAVLLVDQLEPRDRLSVVTFDAAATVVFGPANVTAEARPELRRAIEAIETGVGTNLAAGIKKGAAIIRAGFVRDALSRLILLTDGQPSLGVTDPERLGALVEVESQHGVTTTTMGLGEGFDDELLAELARRGRGGFHYLATPSDIPGAFGRELAGVIAIAATRTELKLVPHASVLSVEVLHRLTSQPLDDGLLVEVGELAGGAPRQVLFKLTRSPREEPEGVGNRCGTLAVSYRLPDGSAGDGHIVPIEVPTAPISHHAREITLERLRLEVASAVDVVWARRASGDSGHALALLAAVRREVQAAHKADLADRTALAGLLEDMTAAEQAVAKSSAERERARRTMRERSHITLLGQSTLAKLPGDED
jgi:Ca-activated chloride channel family protein